MSRLRKMIRWTALRSGFASLADFAGFGEEVRLEASSRCQLRCPLCITGDRRTREPGATVGWGDLKPDAFVRFLDAHPGVRHVELSNYGEIPLNRALPRIIELAHERGVTLAAANGVNLNHISDELIETMVRCSFRRLKVSIDGASQASYEVYRRGGSFERVIENIRRINRAKARAGAKFPRLKWQFIVFGHNEHEIARARRLADELGMRIKFKINYDPRSFPLRNPARVRHELDGAPLSVDEYERRSDLPYSPACRQLWLSPQINWDGKLLGCCVNHYGDFGNVFESGLDALLASERYRYARRMVLGLAGPRDDVPCTRCQRYRGIKAGPFRRDLLRELKTQALR